MSRWPSCFCDPVATPAKGSYARTHPTLCKRAQLHVPNQILRLTRGCLCQKTNFTPRISLWEHKGFKVFFKQQRSMKAFAYVRREMMTPTNELREASKEEGKGGVSPHVHTVTELRDRDIQTQGHPAAPGKPASLVTDPKPTSWGPRPPLLALGVGGKAGGDPRIHPGRGHKWELPRVGCSWEGTPVPALETDQEEWI